MDYKFRVVIHHLLCDAWGVAPERLWDEALVRRFLHEATSRLGMTPLWQSVRGYHHPSDPSHDGLSALALIADTPSAVLHAKESHIALHAWPALGYLAAEAASCRPVDKAAFLGLVEGLYAPKDILSAHLPRGCPLPADLADAVLKPYQSD
ncbi:MAG: S-adenosylmethionine decarboxylase [Nitrospinota bacterium]